MKNDPFGDSATILLIGPGILFSSWQRDSLAQQKSPAAAAKSSTKGQPNSAAEMIIAEAEKMKAEAEKLKAEAEKIRADVEPKKIDIENKKLTLEKTKTDDARYQFWSNFVVYGASLVAAGLLLAFIIPTLPLKRIGFGGVDVELQETSTSARTIVKLIPRDLAPLIAIKVESLEKKKPGPSQSLSGRGKYAYERLTWSLYKLLDMVEDPNKLSDREEFRELIKTAYRRARAMGHNTKALAIILHLQKLKDRDLTTEEAIMTGTAYVWAAEEISADDPSDPERQELQELRKQAVSFLLDGYHATRLDSQKAPLGFNMALMFLYLDDYNNVLFWMGRCITLDPEWSPWAKWTIACTYAKLGRNDQAFKALDEIQPTSTLTAGDWSDLWKNIREDDYLANLRHPPEITTLDALVARKIAAKPTSPTS